MKKKLSSGVPVSFMSLSFPYTHDCGCGRYHPVSTTGTVPAIHKSVHNLSLIAADLPLGTELVPPGDVLREQGAYNSLGLQPLHGNVPVKATK